MKKYIGFKMIEAEPMTDMKFNVYEKGGITEDFGGVESEGYKVVGPNAMKWVPKSVFEKSYMPVGDNNTITQDNVESFISSIETSTVGNKSTIVVATLANGFKIIESSSCVDVANYDEEMGKNICMNKIKDKVWMLLGFLLQTAKDGIR